MKQYGKLLAVLLALVLLLSLLPAALAVDKDADSDAPEAAQAADQAEPGEEAAEAPSAEEDAEEPEAPDDMQTEASDWTEPLGDAGEDVLLSPLPVAETVGKDEEFYAEPGALVYNNGGLVYNNGGTVYNNAGTVYNNGGLVYNNAGSVYSNGGIVYNNAGKVYSNGALVFGFEGDVENSLIAGYCRVTLADDYSQFAELEGFAADPNAEDSLLMAQDAVVTITPKEGFSLIEATAEGATLREGDDGVWTLSEPTGNFELSLRFQADAPVFSLQEGSYGSPQTLELSAAEGCYIYYTLDGSIPDQENGLVYEGPITVDESMTVSAVAETLFAEISPIAKASYAVVTVSAPDFEAVEEGYNVPAPQGFTVDNPGAVAAVVESVELTDGDVDCFTLSRTGGSRVSARTVNNKTWAVGPVSKLEAGVYSATATFTFDSGDSVDVELRFEVK